MPEVREKEKSRMRRRFLSCFNYLENSSTISRDRKETRKNEERKL